MMIMKEPLYIDCHTTKIKVILINGQLEQSKILLRANENSKTSKLPQAQGNVISNQVESG